MNTIAGFRRLSQVTVAAAALLAGCGSDIDGNVATPLSAGRQPAPMTATGSTVLYLNTAKLPDEVAQQVALPSFHMAPVLLDPPDDADGQGSSASARMVARKQAVPPEFGNLSTRRLTMATLESARHAWLKGLPPAAAQDATVPLASASAVSTYTPAQIRAAYGFSALAATGTALTAAQAAALGAGQTIYIVDAYHDPNAAAELAAFNAKFGLPGCTTKAIAATSPLPLPAAPSAACEFSIVYNTAAGAMTPTAPAYNSGWATEIALDVQWAHATAPLARIILIESPDASLNGLLGGIKLANLMGPGVVSMSFGANEGNWTASVDSVFTASKMTYLAATGDSGAAVSWPAVSANVVAVGGTSLTWTGTAGRTESGWSGTGGGMSAYVAPPAYQQNAAVPGMWAVTGRTVADVAFNADPFTGQYVAVMAPGATSANWISAGGTSLSTPQWAGVIAIANASRALSSKAALGAPHATLYGQIAAVPGTYASAFNDVTKGADGTCITCAAKPGFDQLTGLGTPNVSSLLATLNGAAAPVSAPVVTPAGISGKIGKALSFTVSVSAPNPVTYTLSGAPASIAISAAGVVTWATPLAGTYNVTVTARDSTTGLSGSGVYTITIAALSAPTVTGTTISGCPGAALSFAVSFTAPNPVTYTLAGAPSGMTISAVGMVNWATPVLGTYNVIVIAKDTKTGLSGSGTYIVKIANAGPVIGASEMSGKAGVALTASFTVTDPGASWIQISLSGVPLGMSFYLSGTSTVVAYWPAPVPGTYSLQVTAKDSAGLSTRAVLPVTITAR